VSVMIATDLRFRELLAVELAVGQPGQLLEVHHDLRHHVPGQPLRQVRSRRLTRHRAVPAHHIRHEHLLAAAPVHDRRRCAVHALHRLQRRLDLFELYPEASDFHLLVDPAQELDLAVFPPPA
jgi:hypothetical protein